MPNNETDAPEDNQSGALGNQPQEPDAADWKAKSRLWEARAKENSAVAAQLKELQDTTQAEAQRQADRISELQAELEKRDASDQVKQWTAEASAAANVPASLLRGATLEELTAHAKALQAWAADLTKPQPVPSEGRSTNTPLTSDEQTFASGLFS